MEVNVDLKFRAVSLAVQTAVISVLLSINVLAMEQIDMKQVTDADKIFFGRRLTPEQIEKLKQISIHGFSTSKIPCEKIVAINKTLHFLSIVTPVFKEASTNDDISKYAKKYSSSVAHEFTQTSKALNEILPRYKKICAASQKKRHDTELEQNGPVSQNTKEN
jgi:hypothetical protein